MLVLSRRTGQKILIGDDIEITVIRLSGSRVKLGIQAPRNVSVEREEIHTRPLDPHDRESELPPLFRETIHSPIQAETNQE